MERFLAKYQIRDEVLAVGVSGGADSMALVLQAREELALYGRKVVALTVNHGLRPSAAEEARYVGKVMAEHGIEHHILVWEGEKPSTGVEEAARTARYALIKEWCDTHGVKSLMVAHHVQDQAETFLMRLQRGSGLEGLCCMREVSYWNGLQILRPFLHTNPECLRDYLRRKNIAWIEDESNECDDFLRCRIRKFLPELAAKTGIVPARIDEAVSNLQSAESFLEAQVAEIKARDVAEEVEGVFSIRHTDYLRWHPEVKFRILAQLCRRSYIPRADSVLGVVEKLDRLPFSGVTLGGREIFSAYGKIWIVPEMAAKRKASRKLWQVLEQKEPAYKGRWLPHKVKLAILHKLGVHDNDL